MRRRPYRINEQSLVGPKTHPAKMKLPSIFGSLLGSIIGFTTFILLVTPYFLNDRLQHSYGSIDLLDLDAVLLGPGLIVFFMIGGIAAHFGLVELQNPTLSMVIIAGVPSIPPTIIGWLIGSGKKFWRIFGIVSFVLYILFIMFTFTFWLSIWS